MRHTRVKICGITNESDGLAACDAGADALGFVFYSDSPRCVTAEQAAQICRRLPPFVTRVGLFVNAEAGWIREVVRRTGLDLLQFHGDESADFCAGFERPWVKAVRMKEGVDLRQICAEYADCAALLLDSHVAGVYGGTGSAFCWQRVPSALDKPVILAGGLRAENVGEAIRAVKPYAVDVSGGVEKRKKGDKGDKADKDHAEMRRFIHAVRHALD